MSADDDRSRRGCLLGAAAMVVLLVLTPIVAASVMVVMGASTIVAMGGAMEESQCSRGSTEFGVTSAASGPVRLPVTGQYKYTSPFGQRVHPIRQVSTLHAGMDLATIPVGGPIVAFQSGTVTSVTHGDPGAGNFVVIDHGSGIVSRYLHLSSISVKAGDKVEAGDEVGQEGSTGSSTASHLHFEVRRGGQPVDPAAYLREQGLKVPDVGGVAEADAGTGGGKASTAGASASSTSSGGSSSSAERVGAWSGEQVEVAAAIVKRGEDRDLDEWTITVAVMTAMAESSLKNLKTGDSVRSDTVGVFQEGPERGPLAERMDPADAADIFWDYLEKVEGYRDLSPTIAAHRAQANADPWHYADMWDDAVEVVAAIQDNPDLKAQYVGSGSSSDCHQGEGIQAPQGGELPDPPGMECPASSSPGESGLQPVALRGLRCTAKAFPEISTMYGVGERVGPSDHGVGLAVDFMIEDYRSSKGRSYGWQTAEWVRQHADKLGVTYVIWDQKIWNSARDGEGWRPMEDRGSDTENHLDHVHVSYS